jgi:hypothetical protein
MSHLLKSTHFYFLELQMKKTMTMVPFQMIWVILFQVQNMDFFFFLIKKYVQVVFDIVCFKQYTFQRPPPITIGKFFSQHTPNNFRNGSRVLLHNFHNIGYVHV